MVGVVSPPLNKRQTISAAALRLQRRGLRWQQLRTQVNEEHQVRPSPECTIQYVLPV